MGVWKYGSEKYTLYIPQNHIFNSKNFSDYPYSYTPILPHSHTSRAGGIVGKDGFEPPNSEENRFTVCCRWPLDYLPDGILFQPEKNMPPIPVTGSFAEPERGIEPATC
jgi:hypothetical protein